VNRNLLGGAAIVVIAAAAGYFAQRTLTSTETSLKEAPPAAASQSAPASAPDDQGDEAPPPRTIPETLPEVSLADRSGAQRSLAEWKGRPLIVNFWATWCTPCRNEIPLLQALRKERAKDRLEIVGIAIDERAAVLKYAADIGMDYPILIGEQDGYEAAERFGVALVLPFSAFADSQGRIVTLKVGELHADEAAFILDRVRDVDANRVELADARRQIADKLRDFAAERARKAEEDHSHDDEPNQG
jgi:thiol-disulfide isomerase/thioredoxin